MKWIAAISALRWNIGTGDILQINVEHKRNICLVEAELRADAESIGLSLARERWPQDDGWRMYDAQVVTLDSTTVVHTWTKEDIARGLANE